MVTRNAMDITSLKVESLHQHTIQINHQLDATVFPVLLLDIYLQLNIFRAFSRPSSGAQQMQWQPLALPSEHGGSSAVGRCRVGRPAGPTTTNSTPITTLRS
jgi:hypothetical protein